MTRIIASMLARLRTPLPHQIGWDYEYMVIAHQYWPANGPAALRLTQLVHQIRLRNPQARIAVITANHGGPRLLVGPNKEDVRSVASADHSGQSLQRIRSLVAFVLSVSLTVIRFRSKVVICDPPPFATLVALALTRLRGGIGVYYFCDSWKLVALWKGGLATRARYVIAVIETRCLKLADLVLASEEALRVDAISRGAGRLCLTRNGTAIGELRNTEQAAPWSPFAAPMPYFVYPGTHSEVHGARIFVEAAEKLWQAGRQFGVVFVGSGSDARWVQSRVSRSDGRLHHYDAMPFSDLARLMLQSTACLASLGSDVPADYYATPSKIYTALGLGNPVIYSGPRLPVAFLDENELGHVCARDVDEVGQAMTTILDISASDPSRYSQWRQKIKKYASTHHDFALNMEAAVEKIDALRNS